MSLQNYPTAGLLRRLIAMAYDALVLLALYLVVGFVLVGILKATTGNWPGQFPASVSFSLFYSICFLYYMHSWRRGGQTIGMKSWGLYLITEDEKPVRLSHCILRSAAGFFSLVIFGLGFFWMLIDGKQRTWHDIASLTRIVYKPKNTD